ncbi:MAG: LuxR C-terminal-related transcriptional regulator [Candidatus Limnocylindria bacterium]
MNTPARKSGRGSDVGHATMIGRLSLATEPAPTGVRVRVLIADANDIFRSGLKALLRHEGIDVVGDCRSGSEAVALDARLRPDVILLEEAARGTPAHAATRRLVAAHPGVPVVILANHADEELVLAGICAGAQGFLLKDADPGEFAAAMRSAAAGGSPLSPAAAAHILRRLRRQESRFGGDRDVALTAREASILQHLVAGLSNREIADELIVSPMTVKHHVASILKKLGATNRVQAAVHAVRQGLI